MISSPLNVSSATCKFSLSASESRLIFPLSAVVYHQNPSMSAASSLFADHSGHNLMLMSKSNGHRDSAKVPATVHNMHPTRNIPKASVRNGMWPKNDRHQQEQSSVQLSSPASSKNRSVPTPLVEKASVPINNSLIRRRIMILYDNLQYEELAKFIGKIPNESFGEVIQKLPVNDFLNSLPSSMQIMNSLYCKFEMCKQQELAESSSLQQNSSNSTCPPKTVSTLDINYLHPHKMVLHLMEIFAFQNVTKACSKDSSNSQNPQLLLLQENFTFNHSLLSTSKNILKIVMMYEPSARKQLIARKKGIDKAIQGMGHHGLVGLSDESLVELSDALKIEFTKGISFLKTALAKIDDSIASNTCSSHCKKQPIVKSVTRGPAPTQASHQRQLSLRQEDLQDRLAKNQALLAVIEPCCKSSRCLEMLLEIVEQRINMDKEVLLQYNELRRLFNGTATCSSHLNSVWNTFDTSAMIAPILMKFSHGCGQVISLIKEVCQENNIKECSNEEQNNEDASEEIDRGSDISGYHSGSDSTRHIKQYQPNGKRSENVPTPSSSHKVSSGTHQRAEESQSKSTKTKKNQEEAFTESSNEKEPLISKEATDNNPKKESKISGRHGSVMVKGSIWTQQVHDGSEIDALRVELMKSKLLISKLEEQREKLKDRLAEQAQKMMERTVNLENLGLNEKRPTALIRKYGNLYAQARVDTLDSLDALPPLKDADELKSKLLFSLVVLSFCSVQKTLDRIKEQIKDALKVSKNLNDNVMKTAFKELENSVHTFLRVNIDSFDPRKNSEEVLSQICATLYDYPCLRGCDGLLHYIRDCVSLAWTLSVQTPPLKIEYEFKTFNKDLHIRFHTSNQDSDLIRGYLWPCLIETENGTCVHKGVVVT